MKYLISYFAIVSIALGATGDVQLKQKTASGAFRDITIPVTNSTILGFDGSGVVGKISSVPTFDVGTLNITGNVLPLPPGSISMWTTADIANKPTNTLVCDGTNGTTDITAPTGATAIIVASPTPDAPSVTPASGTYSVAQTVTATGASGAVIYYTTNATDPTRASSVYSAPLTASASAEYRFGQALSPGVISAITSRSYTINTQTFLVHEDFEGAGTPANWTTTGTVNFDYSTTPIGGSQSCEISGATSYANIAFTGASDIWCRVRFRKDIQPTGAATIMVGFMNNTTLLGYVTSRFDNGHRIYNGTPYVWSSVETPNSTAYYVWIHYVAGTGANGVTTAWLGTSTTRPSTESGAVTNGTATATPNNVRIGSGGGTIVFDEVVVSTTEIVGGAF